MKILFFILITLTISGCSAKRTQELGKGMVNTNNIFVIFGGFITYKIGEQLEKKEKQEEEEKKNE